MSILIAGIGFHFIGAASAASFYAPIEKVKRWSWETTWAIAGLFSWIILPIGVSLFLLPDFHAFYASMGSHLLLKVALFGAMWGVGNVNYGLTMRYVGMSLGIGIAIGTTLVVGTLIPPLMNHQAAMLVTTRGGQLTLAGVLVALIGVIMVSFAGHQKEVQLSGKVREFNVKLGLVLAVLCGIFSSGMSFAINAARPMEAAALHLGVNPLYAALPSYVIIMGGGAVVNLSYCFIRLAALRRLSIRARRPGTARSATLAEQRPARRYRRHHVVLAVLLLCVGLGQCAAAVVLRKLDAPHEHVCSLRSIGGPRPR